MSRLLLVALGAIALGLGTAEYLVQNFSFRHEIGKLVRRGELLTLVGRHGIYDRDVERAWQAELFARGAAPQDLDKTTADGQKRAALGRLVTFEKLDDAAASGAISGAAVEREIALLRSQMRDEKAWQEVLQRAAVSLRQLHRDVVRNLRERSWVGQQIALRIEPKEEECRRFFEAHQASLAEPLRFRASHIFLAAPEGYAMEVIETKRALIDTLFKRLANGEAFPALVVQFSEDEATKKRGGDLGYFAAERMLPEVFEAAQQLRPGETSAAIRSRLGFHIIRLIETRPARRLSFEEALPEIMVRLANQKRAAAVAGLVAALR